MFAEQFYEFFRSPIFRRSRPEVFWEKVFLKISQYSQQDGKKPGAGAGLPQSEDMSYESWPWL